MRIKLIDAGKRYNREWIFRHANVNFLESCRYAIIGPNGSGKSTLLQVLAGNIQLNEGKLIYSETENGLDDENIFQYCSIAAPYIDLIEEMTLFEFFTFHNKFKQFVPGLTIKDITSILQLDHALNKRIRFFSSGMKQRVRLGQAVLTSTPVLLLDEPCSYLDERGTDLYYTLIEQYCKGRLVIISSNDEKEYHFCEVQIVMDQFKNLSLTSDQQV
jgi:ABC-type multidrug transport system ATPase subunit